MGTPISEESQANRGGSTLEDYNFESFRREHLIRDMIRSYQQQGIQPGELAPEFELPTVGGSPVRLSDYRGRPLILHFGSFS